jgi:hypothetical protein
MRFCTVGLKLQWLTRSRNAALLGCIVIVLSVGIGPFTQQAVKAVPCNRPLESAEASIRISRWIDIDNLARNYGPYWDMDMNTKIAILNGLANPNTTRSEITPDCNTGNCLFPPYNGITHSSVGLCKKCVDITPSVSEQVTVFHYPVTAYEDQWTLTDRNGTIEYENGTIAYPNGTIKYGNKTIPDALIQNLILPDGHGIGGGFNTSLPSNIISVSGHGTIWRNQAVPLNDSLLDAFDNSFESIFRSSILNISVITFTNNDCHPVEHGEEVRNCSNHGFDTSYPFLEYLNVVATACSFYPCVRDYHGTVRSTEFTELVVRETPIVQPLGQEGNSVPDFLHLHTPCVVDGQVYTMNNISTVPRDKHNFTSSYVDQVNMTFPADCAYGVSGYYALSMVSFMTETLFGNCTTPSRINFDGDSDDYNSVICEPWYLKSLVNKGNASFKSIDLNMESMATAVTSEMRKQGKDYSSPRGTQKQIYTKGTVIQTTVCTQFDWKWLSFPLALATLTSLVLCISCGKMFFDTQNIPAWKSSVLPLLLTGNQIAATTGAEDMDKIKANTRNVFVSLAQFEKGWEFVVENCEDKGKKES